MNENKTQQLQSFNSIILFENDWKWIFWAWWAWASPGAERPGGALPALRVACNDSFSSCSCRSCNSSCQSHILSSSYPIAGKRPFQKSLILPIFGSHASLQINLCSQGNAISRSQVLPLGSEVRRFTKATWPVNEGQGSFPQRMKAQLPGREQMSFLGNNRYSQTFFFPFYGGSVIPIKKKSNSAHCPIPRSIFY